MSGQRVLLIGATGTIGQATARALLEAGHEVRCLVRPRSGPGGRLDPEAVATLLGGAELVFGDPTDPGVLRDAARGREALVSCMASRSGTPADAWAIDHDAHVAALEAARAAGMARMVLLSAICVQKPRLAFQHAKLAFEGKLAASGLGYSVVRPTAFFKSLSGQVARARAGRPWLLFGDGRLTACKPVSDRDLGRFLTDCLTRADRANRILPIGGPGPAITPRDQAERLFAMLGRPPRLRHVPVGLIGAIAGGLGALGRVSPRLAARAELARIGRYYATESMLLLDPATGRYDADATPETGTETLWDHYERLLSGAATDERGDHAVF